MTNAPSPPASPQAALPAERFAAQGFPGGFGLGSFRTYAVVQVWAQAVEHARTFTPRAVAEALHMLQFDTVLGHLGFDQKGDVTGHNSYVWYVCQDGDFVPLDEAAAKD